MINTLCLLLSLSVVGPQTVENLTVLDGGSPSAPRWIDWSDPGLMLVHHLNDLTRACLASREAEIGKLKSAEAWKKRQAKVQRTLDQILGPWPARSPLNPRVTGVLQKDGYRVEKIVFESMPNFYVTGALFIPDGHSGRGPAILDVIGHSGQAFRRDLYQNVILNLVHKGFVVFAIDPLGQGERLQYFDPQKGKSTVGSSTMEHSHVGVQCFLTGRSLARYFTWDGIRAIDYLLTRPEVDPNRIGATGLSGGGHAKQLHRRDRPAGPRGRAHRIHNQHQSAVGFHRTAGRRASLLSRSAAGHRPCGSTRSASAKTDAPSHHHTGFFQYPGRS